MSEGREGVVIITGGAGLIGKKFSESCAGAGYAVVIADIDENNGIYIVNEIRQKTNNQRISFFKCDITSSDDIQALIRYCKERYGSIYALVNNAYPRNVRYGRIFEDVTYEDFCENVCMHLGGFFNITKWIAKEMISQKSGNIINMGSIYGFAAPRFEIYENTPITMPVEYAAIKGAIINLTRYYASYLGRSNIRVNTISPGGIEDHQPETFIRKYSEHVLLNQKMGHPDDISGVLLFLLSDQSRYITGQNIVVDGGWSL